MAAIRPHNSSENPRIEGNGQQWRNASPGQSASGTEQFDSKNIPTQRCSRQDCPASKAKAQPQLHKIAFSSTAS